MRSASNASDTGWGVAQRSGSGAPSRRIVQRAAVIARVLTVERCESSSGLTVRGVDSVCSVCSVVTVGVFAVF